MNYKTTKPVVIPIPITESEAGQRIDIVISSKILSCTRSYASKLISEGRFEVDGVTRKPGYHLKIGELITGILPDPEPLPLNPEPISLDIIYEDPHIIVLNKQPGIVVHPSPGHDSGTIVNAILYHCPDLEGIGGKLRPGIVHRLDKNTSGVLLIAKTSESHQNLSDQFKTRKIDKRYLAIVQDVVKDDAGEIRLPIGRHPTDRKKMSTVSRSAREALTFWKVKERFRDATLLELTIKTGRTHQIRVHCAAINHPVLGDPVYGRQKTGRYVKINGTKTDIRQIIHRQMLHARTLVLNHPVTNQSMSFEAPIPEDIQQVLSALRASL
ncbi:MAG: RluA family pseudouridine synthase [Desulfobacterales bacterium]|nr:RluA family pseudouridine synthase [Desulfobacterales bacterium]MDD4071326.1 RluA family pseudouridine synthase [Desulfobacterales bacterium]MDD4392990.1 RluA family pseudouridine synthase [Desulfobacterales bacterium]